MMYYGVFQIPLLTHIFSQKVFKVSQHLRQVFLVHDHFHVVVLFLGLSEGKMLGSAGKKPGGAAKIASVVTGQIASK